MQKVKETRTHNDSDVMIGTPGFFFFGPKGDLAFPHCYIYVTGQIRFKVYFDLTYNLTLDFLCLLGLGDIGN